MKTINIKNLPPLLKLSEAAQLLNLSPWTLRNWDKKGIIVALRMGARKDRRYKKEDILRVLQEGV